VCRIFGYISVKPLSPAFAFFSGATNLFTLSKEHDDGWGIAWTGSAGWELYKESSALYRSETAPSLIRSIKAMLVIAHIRKASRGELSFENTHPFVSDGWAFAHNGTIEDYSVLRSMLGDREDKLQGNTDSEAFFQLLIKNIEEKGSVVDGVKGTIEAMNGLEYTSLNAIFSDGNQLYVLNYFLDENIEYYTMHIGRFMIDGVELIAAASEPVGGIEGWEKIGNRKLVVIDRRLRVSVYPLP